MKEIARRGLSENEQMVLVMLYYENMTQKEIGAALGLSESRVCQIHKKVLQFLRDKFEHRKMSRVDAD